MNSDGLKKEAQAWLTDALKKKDLGIPTFQSKISVGDYIDEWLKTIAKPRVRENTYNSYESQLNHVKNSLGKVRLTLLQAQDSQKLYGTLPSSVAKHVHAPLSSALSQSREWHLIHSNPCDAVDLSKTQTERGTSPYTRRGEQMMAVERFTRTEGERTVIVENRYRVLFAFLLTTGARPSEAFGLKWSDIDFEIGRVTIQRTLQWHSKKQGGGAYSRKRRQRPVALDPVALRDGATA